MQPRKEILILLVKVIGGYIVGGTESRINDLEFDRLAVANCETSATTVDLRQGAVRFTDRPLSLAGLKHEPVAVAPGSVPAEAVTKRESGGPVWHSV